MTALEVSALLGIQPNTVNDWARRRKFLFPSGVKIKGKWHYKIGEIRAWQRQQSVRYVSLQRGKLTVNMP